MKIFLSWSGKVSGELAAFLKGWLPSVIQSLEPWTSREMEKGLPWSSELAERLEASSFGIVCLTPENAESPWLHFEAGAIAKSVSGALTEGRVSPLLLGLRPADLKPPLGQFQATEPVQEDVLRLITTINSALNQPLDAARLLEAFDRWWPDLASKVEELEARLVAPERGADTEVRTPRPDAELLGEILESVRSQERALLRLEQEVGGSRRGRETSDTDLVKAVYGAAAGFHFPLKGVEVGDGTVRVKMGPLATARSLDRFNEWLQRRAQERGLKVAFTLDTGEERDGA